MKAREWFLFGLLGLVWGSSFLWIKVAVRDIGPITLVAFRLLFGLVGLLAVVAVRRPPFPSERRTWAILGLLGLTNTALPFILISWGEQYIDSAVASILNGTVPLFTLVIAHLSLHDDRITSARVLGLVTGFAGVVVLVSRDLEPQGFGGGVLGQVAVLAAAVSYAGSSVFARRNLRRVDPIVQAFVPLIAADASAWLAIPWLEAPFDPPSLPLTWLALAWLGLLDSCLAYLLYFHLLHALGPTRATMVTYVFPVVGLILGVVFLAERADWHLGVGAALVAASIAVVNWKPKWATAPASAD
ncbi:MAG: DMT family transporter [Chloroflexota bacterium]